MHFLDPTNDYAFKKVFGNENKKELLISFLNSILKREGDRLITDVTLLNPNQAPHIKGAKNTILDVRCHDQSGAEYIVEMQVLKQSYFDKRVLFYASRAYSSQLDEAEAYEELRPVIFLGILNFIFEKQEQYISTHRIYNVETNLHMITDFQFTFVELPKFLKLENELVSIADKWIFFLKHAKELEAIPQVIHEEAIKEAFAIVNRINWTQEELDGYERRIMTLRDEAARIHYGYTKGLDEGLLKGKQQGLDEGLLKGKQEGLVEGLLKGKQQGLDEGLLKGKQQGLDEGLLKGKQQGLDEGLLKGKQEIARNLLQTGFSVSEVSRLTGLSVEEIQNVHKPVSM